MTSDIFQLGREPSVDHLKNFPKVQPAKKTPKIYNLFPFEKFSSLKKCDTTVKPPLPPKRRCLLASLIGIEKGCR